MKATKLADKYSIKELNEMMTKLTSDPANRTEGFYLYNAKTRKKMDEISWAITYKMNDKMK